MLKALFRKQSPCTKIFYGSQDFPSMKQMIETHVSMLSTQEPKYMKTSCSTTLRIAENILQNNQFLKENILGCPGTNTTQTGSLKVKICDINKHQSVKSQYKKWAEKGKSRMVAIGGPSAYDQTLISTLIEPIRSTHDINFYCRNYLETNVLHSANQSHARHGNALNADPVLSGRYLLPLVFKRMLFKTTVNEVTNFDYIKVDVKLNNPKYLVEYLKNQYNGIKQIYKTWRGQKNEHDINRFESVISQQIQKVMQKSSGLVFTTNHGQKKSDSMAIHLTFTEKSLHQLHEQQEQFKQVKQIVFQELASTEIKNIFPDSKNIVAAYKYHGDFSNVFNMYELQKQKATSLGASWQENKTLSKVYVDKDAQGNPFACGVEFEDGEFVPADKIHLTLGYKASYEFQSTGKNALNNINVPATGCSTTLVVKKTPVLKKIIEENGYLDLAMINSHWTIVASDDEHVLIRATAGGNTGAQTYMPSYFLNLIVNTRNIFGDSFVGVVGTYGCARAVNYKNSTQFAKLADGLIVSYGKGGTGNTKRASQAYKALKYLGFSKQINQFFNQYEPDRANIVESMEDICKQSKVNNFYYDNSKKTRRSLFL